MYVPTGMYMASIITDSGSSMQSILFHSSTMGVELVKERERERLYLYTEKKCTTEESIDVRECDKNWNKLLSNYSRRKEEIEIK